MPVPSANYFKIHPNSTLTLFISSLHLISVIPFVSYALKKTITAARELILAQKKKKQKKNVCRLTTASVTFGPSWPFSPGDPMSPGKPCNDQFKIKIFIHAHWSHIFIFIAAVSIQTSGPGGPGAPSGPFSPILPCNRDQQEYLKHPLSL